MTLTDPLYLVSPRQRQQLHFSFKLLATDCRLDDVDDPYTTVVQLLDIIMATSMPLKTENPSTSAHVVCTSCALAIKSLKRLEKNIKCTFGATQDQGILLKLACAHLPSPPVLAAAAVLSRLPGTTCPTYKPVSAHGTTIRSPFAQGLRQVDKLRRETSFRNNPKLPQQKPAYCQL